MLGFYRQHWSEGAFHEELRGPVYGLSSLFEKAAEDGVPAPADEAELVPLLERYIYAERGADVGPHFVHVETDDDEVDIEYFFFDDCFLAEADALDRLPRAGRKKDRYAAFLAARASP